VNESWAHDPRIGGAGLALEPGQRLGRGRRGLAVLPMDVVNAADRGSGAGRVVWSPVVVLVEPVWQRLVSLSM
jgi:hypothetical protein